MDTTAGNSVNLGNELRSDAHTIADSAKQRIHSEVDARKGGAAGQARAVSSALNRASQELESDGPSWLRSAFDNASKTVQRLADTVEQKDSRQLTRDVQQLAREHPASFLAACALAGFAAARVMQAGAGSDSGSGSATPSVGERREQTSLGQPAMSLPGSEDPYVTQGGITEGRAL
jgi:hypothetical protein